MRTRSALLVVVLGGVLASCGEEKCDVVCPAVACLKPFSLGVTDAALALIPNASATSTSLSCSTPAIGIVECDVGGAPGSYAVSVSAPGYSTLNVSVTVQAPPAPPGACECPRCQEWEPRWVTLQPAP